MRYKEQRHATEKFSVALIENTAFCVFIDFSDRENGAAKHTII